MAFNTADALAIVNGITAQFDTQFMNTQVVYPDVCTTLPTVRANEKIMMRGDVPAMREFVGERIGEQLAAWDIDTKVKSYEQTIEIPRYYFEDDINAMYANVGAEMATRAAQQPDALLLDHVNNGHQRTCWDGKNFFAADHVIEKSGNIANTMTSTVSLATLTSTQLRDAVVDAAIQMVGFKDSKGLSRFRFVEWNEANFLLWVPLAMAKQANEAYQAQLIGNTSNVTMLRPTVRAMVDLTDNRSFYLFYRGSATRPFLFIPRSELRRQAVGFDSIENKNVKYLTEWRFNVECFAYWNCVKYRFAT